MRILVTGSGCSGSWKIRGVQLGAALGAVVSPRASLAQCKDADIIVGVKRVPPETLQAIRDSRKPWVWDVVDAWPQPAGVSYNRMQAVKWLRAALDSASPSAVVWPTRAMQDDAGYARPQKVVYHHAWPKYQPAPLNEVVRRVGYEGGTRYLGRWAGPLRKLCAMVGAELVINGDLSTCDIGVALRDAGGYPAQQWKSNCKLANLQALGIAAICSPESGYRETSSGAEYFIEDEVGLQRAFAALLPLGERERCREAALRAAPSLGMVAEEYRTWLTSLV